MLLRNYFYYKQFEQYWCSLYWYRYYYFYLVNGFRHNLSILRWKNYAKKLKRRAFSLYQCDGKVVGRRKRYWRTNYLTELCLWFKYREDLFKKRYYTREMYYWCVCISRYNLNIARMSWRIKKAKYSKLFFFNIVNSIPLIFGGFQMQKSLDIYLSTNLFVYGMNIYYRKKKNIEIVY